jgi:hypothetical protein
MIRARLPRFLPTLALLGALLMLGAATARAQVEEFDDPDPAGWERTPGASIADGTLVVPPDEAAFRPEPWGGDTLSIRLRWEGPGITLISFAATDRGANHLLITDDGRLVLQRDTTGGPEELAATEASVLAPEEWTTITLGAADGPFTVAVDGDAVLDVDADLRSLRDGGVVIESGGERTTIIDSVSGAAAPGEPEDVPEPEPDPETEALTTTTVTDADDGGSGFLDDFFNVNAANVDIGEFAINLALAGLLAFVLSRVYIHWGTALSNRRRFANNFMLVAVTTTFIILVVRSSVALSLGLVGALSIVRFRAAIKDPEELAYMFLAIGIGIGLGDNQRLITIIALTAAIVIIMLVKAFHRRQEDFNLHVTVAAEGRDDIDLAGITAALEPHCAALRLSRYDETPGGTEAVFLAEFRTGDDLLEMRRSVRSIAPDAAISFLEDKGVW